jgi:hypothetical protein
VTSIELIIVVTINEQDTVKQVVKEALRKFFSLGSELWIQTCPTRPVEIEGKSTCDTEAKGLASSLSDATGEFNMWISDKAIHYLL